MSKSVSSKRRPTLPASAILRMFTRGFTKRCARCGQGRLFRRWLYMVPACPRCGLQFEREEGYWVGAMTLNIVLAELLFVVAIAIGVILTWPDLPVVPLIAAGVLINIAFPIFFYPFSKTLWLAVDLSFFHRISASDLR